MCTSQPPKPPKPPKPSSPHPAPPAPPAPPPAPPPPHPFPPRTSSRPPTKLYWIFPLILIQMSGFARLYWIYPVIFGKKGEIRLFEAEMNGFFHYSSPIPAKQSSYIGYIHYSPPNDKKRTQAICLRPSNFNLYSSITTWAAPAAGMIRTPSAPASAVPP
ncbi:hypothetical protein A8990_112100 [Paenibacillus taihuensis]|uniref:Uncharacterized protein n=1 Tax=Paenibacillus taihuensis TaxID=1156355 RepID=A0A3D9S7Q6_9BACL|nr:hypothetical protein A8990_112100 [Paenibacillus taihuensis]